MLVLMLPILFVITGVVGSKNVIGVENVVSIRL